MRAGTIERDVHRNSLLSSVRCRAAKDWLRAHGEGVGVGVSFNVLPDVKIPELSDEVQERVERAVREMAGLLVTDVAIEVRNVVGQPKARVE